MMQQMVTSSDDPLHCIEKYNKIYAKSGQITARIREELFKNDDYKNLLTQDPDWVFTITRDTFDKYIDDIQVCVESIIKTDNLSPEERQLYQGVYDLFFEITPQGADYLYDNLTQYQENNNNENYFYMNHDELINLNDYDELINENNDQVASRPDSDSPLYYWNVNQTYDADSGNNCCHSESLINELPETSEFEPFTVNSPVPDFVY